MAAICVYCASGEGIDRSFVELAADVGTRLAADGHALVSGGGRVSMMGAVARAARAGGAHTTGVIPVHLQGREIGRHRRRRVGRGRHDARAQAGDGSAGRRLPGPCPAASARSRSCSRCGRRGR